MEREELKGGYRKEERERKKEEKGECIEKRKGWERELHRNRDRREAETEKLMSKRERFRKVENCLEGSHEES